VENRDSGQTQGREGRATRRLLDALRAVVFAWSPRSYEFRLVCAALIAGFLARWAHLSMLWAIISAILVFQPDRAATQHHTRIRFIATLIGAAASVGAVALGLRGVPAFAVALVATCSICAATGLEEGLRPAGVATAVLLIRADAAATEADELRFALDRIMAVLGGGFVSLLVAQIPGLRLPPHPPGVD